MTTGNFRCKHLILFVYISTRRTMFKALTTAPEYYKEQMCVLCNGTSNNPNMGTTLFLDYRSTFTTLLHSPPR
jgi:hypothetical protein